MAQKKPNWNFAPPDAEAGCAEGPQHFAAWYKRDGKGEVLQICEASGVSRWTWMGGRVDFPIPHELRPAEFPLNNSKSISKADLVFAALVDCVTVMERDLNGLALIQPELKQAKKAIDQFELVDAEFVEWNGEGLPPVGIPVEAHIDHSWISAEVLAHGVDGEDEVAVLQVGSRIKTKTFTGIRPIRTPEQIAAEERESNILDLADELSTYQERETGHTHKKLAEYLYDHGYRKQVTP